MGKVFDALQRAEEQRARRAGEGALAGVAPLPETGASGARPLAKGPRRPFWRRWLSPSRSPVVEDAGALNKRRIAMLQPNSFVAEQFRSLRARIDSMASSRPIRTLAVTSADPGDGKTMAAVNLALVMSMGIGKRVLLVDCDLRRPRVSECLGLRVEAGLGELLRGTAEVDDALMSVEGTALQVLAVRTVPGNPSELLASDRMRELFEKLIGRFDCVILDVPPTIGLPDAQIVSDLCDGILFVVRADKTPAEDVEAALQVLDRSRVLGVVLNDSEAGPGYGYGG
jgi:capsular exopolysaccharide synthesis family protein